ncbi:hypothetical protein ACNUIM_32165 [Pseudomonas aeruginosa]|uniref:DUF7210 family protein n=5 Tax=Pseudomonas aeruginosa TaxID=287 RepID=UPI003AAC45D9
MSTPAKKQDIPAVSVPKEEKVTLTAHHTHAGTKYPAGAEIYVNTLDKAFLVQHQKITVETQDAAPPPRSKSCRCFPSRVGSGPASACPTAS